MENIIEQLKKLKSIQPEAEYSQRSKLVILSSPIPPGKKPVSSLSENVLGILKKLREIRPEADYARLSKLAILGIPALSQTRRLFSPSTLRVDNKRSRIINWQLAFTVASLLLVLISGRLIHNLKPTAPNLDTQAIQTEFNNLNIDIQLAKIDYSQKANETVSLALTEITSKQTSHLNPIILESEQNKLNAKPSNNKDIDNLLNQLLL